MLAKNTISVCILQLKRSLKIDFGCDDTMSDFFMDILSPNSEIVISVIYCAVQIIFINPKHFSVCGAGLAVKTDVASVALAETQRHQY